MAELFLEGYLKAENKIQAVIDAGVADPSIKDKVLNYIIEGVQDKTKYLAGVQVLNCALSNSFLTKNDIKLKEIERRLFSICRKQKNDSEIVEILSGFIAKVYALFIQNEDMNYTKIFGVFWEELDSLFKQQDTYQVGIRVLQHILLVWDGVYPSCGMIITNHLKTVLNLSKDDKTVNSAIKLCLFIIQQQPTEKLRAISGLIEIFIQKMYSQLSTSTDISLFESLQDAIVVQSILFRNLYTIMVQNLKQQVTYHANENNNHSINNLNQQVYQAALKAVLLLFDKQKKYLIQQNSNSPVQELITILFEYLATENINDETLRLNNSLKLTQILTDPLFHKTQFVLTQLRDLSKILTLSQVKQFYIELFVSLYSRSTKSLYAAFIAFSTIGEYKVDAGELEEFIKLAVKKIKNGSLIEKFSALNAISFLCDFLGEKFTNKYRNQVLKKGLIGSLSTCDEEIVRAQVYSTLTLFMDVKTLDFKALMERIIEYLSLNSKNERSTYYCLILIDLLVEKFSESLKNYAEMVYKQVKRISTDNLELLSMKYEVQANFIQKYYESTHISGDINALLANALEQRSLPTFDSPEKQYEHVSNQMNLLYKLSLALEKSQSLRQKQTLLIDSAIYLLTISLSFLVKHKLLKEESEDAGETSLDHPSNLSLDLNAPEKAFQALAIIYKNDSHPEYKAEQVLQLALKVLRDLNDHLNMRDSAVDILPVLFGVLKESKSESLKEGVYEMVKALVNNIQAETDHGVILDQLELIHKTLEQAGKCFDSVDMVKNIIIFLFDICEESVKEISQKPHIRGEEKEEDDDENNEQLELVQVMGPIIELMFKTHTEEVLVTNLLTFIMKCYACFDEVVSERVMGLCDSEDEAFKLVGYNILSSLLTTLNYEKLKDYIDEFFAYFTEGIEAETYPLKQTSVFGLGLLCQIIPSTAFKQFALFMQEAIVSCILHEPEGINLDEMDEEQDEEFGYFIDNSISALARLIKYQNKFEEAGPFIDLLPLKYDEEEALIVHEIFLDLVLQNKFSDKFNKAIKESLQRVSQSDFINDSIKDKLLQIAQIKKYK